MMPTHESTPAAIDEPNDPIMAAAHAVSEELIVQYKSEKQSSKDLLQALIQCPSEHRQVSQFDEMKRIFKQLFTLMAVATKTEHHDKHATALAGLAEKPSLAELLHTSRTLLVGLSSQNWLLTDGGRLSSELKDLIGDIEQANTCLSQSLESQNIQLRACEKKLISLGALLAQAEQETERLRSSVSGKEEKITDLERDNLSLKAAADESEAHRAKWVALESEHDALKTRLAELEALVEENAKCHGEMAKGLEELQQREQLALEQTDLKDKTIQSLEGDVQHLSTQVQTLTEQIALLTSKLSQVEKERTGFQDQVGQLRARELEKSEQHLTTIAGYQKKIDVLNTEKSTSQDRFGKQIGEAVDLLAQSQKKVASLEAVLKASNESRAELSALLQSSGASFTPAATGQTTIGKPFRFALKQPTRSQTETAKFKTDSSKKVFK